MMAWAWAWALALWMQGSSPCVIDASVVWSSPVRPNALIMVCLTGKCGDDPPTYKAASAIWVTPTTGSVCESCAGTVYYGCAYGNPGDHIVEISVVNKASMELPVRLYLRP